MTPLGLQDIDADSPSAHWRMVDCISDLHLDAQHPKTFQAFSQYIRNCQADALFILGDLFEVWVGDDVLSSVYGSFYAQCTSLLRDCSHKRPTYVMRGNRDFLLGDLFFERSGCHALHDPCVLTLGQKRYCLSHGDAYCLQDHAYMTLRQTVRQEKWASTTLAQPLETRLKIATQLRQESSAYQKSLSNLVDLDKNAMLSLLEEHRCSTLIHGHTHQPQDSPLDLEKNRIVLSDWDFDAPVARGSVLRLQSKAPYTTRIPWTAYANTPDSLE